MAAAVSGPGAIEAPKSAPAAVAVLPGDDVTRIVLTAAAPEAPVQLGAGLMRVVEHVTGGKESEDKDRVVATVAGSLQFLQPATFWVASNPKRYIPCVEDTVIGVVTDRSAEAYKVDLGATGHALLPQLAFQGASKRNRPNLSPGALVYARVVTAHAELEPELSCCVAHGETAKDWMTGESVFGELAGGQVFRCSQGLARQLVHPECPVLEALGSALPFEIAVGGNGVVWLRAASIESTVLVMNALRSSEFLGADAARALVRKLLAAMA